MNRVFSRSDQTEKRRSLRAAVPPAEAILWRHLRGEALGAKFRRQHSVGAWVLDFYCAALRLAIEIDGPSHQESVEADAVRQNWIESYGVTFLRFSNAQVYREREAVVETIRAAVEEKQKVAARGEGPCFEGTRSDGPLCPSDISPLAGGELNCGAVERRQESGRKSQGNVSPFQSDSQSDFQTDSPPAKGEMSEGQRGTK